MSGDRPGRQAAWAVICAEAALGSARLAGTTGVDDDDFTGRNGNSGGLAENLRLLLNDSATEYACPRGCVTSDPRRVAHSSVRRSDVSGLIGYGPLWISVAHRSGRSGSAARRSSTSRSRSPSVRSST
jgi:hypothetical protein